MKRTTRPWFQMLLILSLAAGLLPMNTAMAAARITITSLYVTTAPSQIANGKPANDNLVPRVTTGFINLLATIESIPDAELPNLYLTITNVTTNQTVEERAITAQKTGPFDISFNGVPLTEGLNRIVIKLGGASVVESAPGWVYYTATTSIANLRVNGELFSENRFFPSNPAQSTVLNVSGQAQNAAEVRVNVFGSPTPVTGFFNQGEFFFIGDDINKGSTTANLQLKAGDNPLTFIALNNSKAYQIERTLVYDTGFPFAFRATIDDGTAAGKQQLVKNPTVTAPSVTVNSLVKVDLAPSGQPQYRYVEISSGGKRFGPYDLAGAESAVRVTDIFPKTIYQGHSNLEFTIIGTALDDVELFLESNDGSIADVELAEGRLTADGTAKTFLLDITDADQQLLSTHSPYKLTAHSAGVALETFSINIVTPPDDLPTVSADTEISVVEAGSAGTPDQTIEFEGHSVDDSESIAIQITDITGTSVVGTGSDIQGYADSTPAITFNLPSYLLEGYYKFRVVYGGYVLTERSFVVDPEPAAAPVITNVVGSEASYNAGAGTKTYLFVQGNNFGTDPAAITLPTLDLDNGAELLPLTLYDLTNTSMIFELADQADVDDGESYDLAVTVNGSLVTFPGAVTGNELTLGTDTDGKAITGVTPLQYTVEELNDAANTITATGLNLDDETGSLAVVVLSEDGTGAGVAMTSNITANSLTVTLPVLTAGSYILSFSNTAFTSTTVLAQYPFTIAAPAPTALSPNLRAVNAPDATAEQALTLTGTGFGRELSRLKLRFTSDETGGIVSEKTAERIVGGTAALFDAPIGLPEGTFTVDVLYNNVVVEGGIQYTVSSPPATLRENSAWSKAGQYRVYEFEASLDLPSDRNQNLEFRFYNLPTDNVPPTSFAFQYENPDLPYIARVEMTNGGSSFVISESATNEVSEQPTTLVIYTNTKANSLNYYIGNYSSSATPSKATSAGVSADGFKKFEVVLEGLQNGVNDITFIPSVTTLAAADPATKTGENLAGRRMYSFNVSSTPYIIINNLYSGMVIRDLSELSCITHTGSLLSSCIQGRLVNVPASDYDLVDVYVNSEKFTLSNTAALDDFLDNSNRFWFRFGPGTSRPIPSSSGGNLLEGKNTIRFVINREVNGVAVPITEASFEIFKFSTNAPEFLSIRPVETTDIVKYRPTNIADSFATNESTVRFNGQFANATEIRLTVRTVDPVTGNTVNVYDRRYGSGFNQFEPVANNPIYFQSINSPTSGQFSTRAITLAPRGDTVFEFTITNATNIVVTRTITITREPLPYVIISPRMTENATGSSQANINSNYVEFVIEAENADAVLFRNVPAIAREVTDPTTGLRVKRFFYEAKNLRQGSNNIDFTVVRGQERVSARVVVFNVNTPVEGAQYKTGVSNRIRAFNNMVELTFPRNTNLMRNDPTAINQYITATRQILLGIANSQDGRIDKYKHPAASDGQIGNPNPLVPSNARLMLIEPTGRFRAASPLIWIDAGTISKDTSDVSGALNGSGRLPYDDAVFYTRSQEDLVVPSQPGTLTLKYDPIIRNDGWKYITVYHYDIFEDHRGVTGWRWRNIGGVVNPGNNTITVPFYRFGYYQVMYMSQSFDDVISHPWARDQVDILFSRGIMINKTNTSFVPNDPISRGEFTTLLVKIFDLPLQYNETPTFTDVLRVNPLANGLYDYRYIETAARAGIIRGSGGGRFQPDAAITRQDAAVMIARAANLRLETNETRSLTQLQRAFTDANSIDLYARAAVQAVSDDGLIVGRENVLLAGQNRATFRFDPTATFTRAEAATVAIRVMQAERKIP